MPHDPAIIVIVEPPGPFLAIIGRPGPVLAAEVTAQGPPGPPGPAQLGGLPVRIEDPAEGDLLGLHQNAWTNQNRATLTDGGNF